MSTPPGQPSPDELGIEKIRLERGRAARKATLTHLVGRLVALGVSFISVPLSVAILHDERFGLWATLTSLVTWFGLLDLGIGNQLTSEIAHALGNRDVPRARVAVAGAIALSSAIGLVVLVAFVACSPLVDWNRVLGASARVEPRELSLTLGLTVGLFAVGLPLGITDRVCGGCQETHVASAWSIAGSVVALVALAIVARVDGGLPALVLAIAGTPVLARLAMTVHVFAGRHRELLPRSLPPWATTRALLRGGAGFLVVQLASLGMYHNDIIIISQLFGAEAVGAYSVAWRLATLWSAVVAAWLSPLWPAYADAAARGDTAWLVSHLRTTTLRVVGTSIAFAIGLVTFGPWFIGVWTRSPALVPSRALLATMGVTVVLIGYATSRAIPLNALMRLRGQMLYGLAAALTNIVLSILLGIRIGVIGVCLATALSLVVPAILSSLELRGALRDAASRDRRAAEAP